MQKRTLWWEFTNYAFTRALRNYAKKWCDFLARNVTSLFNVYAVIYFTLKTQIPWWQGGSHAAPFFGYICDIIVTPQMRTRGQNEQDLITVLTTTKTDNIKGIKLFKKKLTGFMKLMMLLPSKPLRPLSQEIGGKSMDLLPSKSCRAFAKSWTASYINAVSV